MSCDLAEHSLGPQCSLREFAIVRWHLIFFFLLVLDNRQTGGYCFTALFFDWEKEVAEWMSV